MGTGVAPPLTRLGKTFHSRSPLDLILRHILLIRRLYQRHALKAFRASVEDEEGHKADCILALRPVQALKIHSHPSPLENLLPAKLPGFTLRERIKW